MACNCGGSKSVVKADRVGEKNLLWKHTATDGETVKMFPSRAAGKEYAKLHGGTLMPELKKSS